MDENMQKQNPIKYPGFMKNFKRYCTEYTEHTSLHGVKYIGEKKRNITERIGWLLILGISVYLCIGFMIKSYNKWESSPVIVSFAEKPWPVWKIPFPAITICPQTKSRQSVYNFTHQYKTLVFTESNFSIETLKVFQDSLLVCDFDVIAMYDHIVDNKTLSFLSEIAPPLNETIFTCDWRKNGIDCDDWFSSILTDEGICYTFNLLNKKDIYSNITYIGEQFLNNDHNNYGWTLENGYKKGAKHYYPKRARSSGSEEGFTFLLATKKSDLDYMCKGPVQGFKMLLHQPGEIPRVKSQYIHLPLDHEVVVSVKPEMMTTSDDLRSYEPYRRLCYFSWERSLLFFKTYSQRNCELECITNYTLVTCNCTAYHMPRKSDTVICGTDMNNCLFEARDELISGFINESSNINCDCLPDCTSLTYNAESSITTFNWTPLFNAHSRNMSAIPDISLTQVTIFFKENQFLPSCRYEVFGITDFISDCGGLFGLFIGFSILSLIEIIYFMTCRLLCNMRRYGKQYWSASPDLLRSDDIV